MSSVTPIRPGGDGANPAQDEKSMPSREVLEKRLENEEERLCQASNILDVIALLLDSRDQGDDHVIWGNAPGRSSSVGRGHQWDCADVSAEDR